MNIFEALESLISKTGCMNDTCANLNECLKSNFCKYNTGDLPSYPMCPDYEMAKTLKNALLELKAIKEAKPSEAMECVDDLIFNFTVDEYVDRYDKNLVTIKNYIFNTQELEKENAEYKEALRIIFEKKVNMFNLKVAIDNNSLRLYNNTISNAFKHLKLTEEEFDTLKRWSEK